MFAGGAGASDARLASREPYGSAIARGMGSSGLRVSKSWVISHDFDESEWWWVVGGGFVAVLPPFLGSLSLSLSNPHETVERTSTRAEAAAGRMSMSDFELIFCQRASAEPSDSTTPSLLSSVPCLQQQRAHSFQTLAPGHSSIFKEKSCLKQRWIHDWETRR